MNPLFTGKQGRCHCPDENHAGVLSETGDKDPDPRRKTKKLEFLNAMLSDCLTLAQRKQFGLSSEKYADGYTQRNLFNDYLTLRCEKNGS